MKRLFRNVVLIFLLLGAGGAAYAYWQALRDNVRAEADGYELLIPKGANFEYVCNELEAGQVLKNLSSFQQISKVRKYNSLVKPGRYRIAAGTSNWDLVRKLRAGDQDQMKLRFRTHWTLEELADEIGDQLMLDADDLYKRMKDDDFLATYGMNRDNVRNLFIPNTYFVYWTMDVEELFDKLKSSYDEYWNSSRKAKLKALGMTQHEVLTLASIVQAETYMPDERPTVAGLYLNRIRDGIPLQADPTVIFAHGDFTIKRVLKRHLELDSPYNTYKVRGLPPGPINNPEPSAIDAVLNHEDHNYIYMCAKADFSGYHNFARTLSQHNRNAKAYQVALSKEMRKKRAQEKANQ